MKKSIILILALFLIMLPTIFAIEIKLSKENYYPRETLQAEITGNFVSLNSENIFVYREGTPRSIPIISDLTKQNNIYYFYAILPRQEDNYTLRIEDSEYYSEGELVTETLIKNFTIQKTNQSALSIDPGFVLAEKDFSIKIKSLTGNQDITAELEDQEKELSLIEEVEEFVLFSISEVEEDTNIRISNYNVPLFIIKKTNDTFIPGERQLFFSPPEIKTPVIPEDNYRFEVYLENLGEENLTNIELSSDLDATITPDSIDFLEVQERTKINISISIPKKAEDTLSGEIIAEFNDKRETLPVSLEITADKKEVNLTGTSITESLSCAAQNGKICLEDEECSGEKTASLEGVPCCLGKCNEKKESSPRVIIGIGLLILIIGFIVFSYLRLKKRKSQKSAEEIFKERSARLRKRMNPDEEPEVSGKLEKV